MTIDVPEDIWREIVKCAIALPGGHELSSLGSLASINKLLRDITVPIIFQSLRFSNKTAYHDHVFNTSLTQLIWTYHRARSLYRTPHLLGHVREVSLNEWSDNTFESPGRGIEDMLPVIYDCLITLMGRMPKLQHITVSTSPIVPRLLYLLSSSPHIDRLSLGAPAVDIPPGIPMSNHIRHFHYRPRNNISTMDGYFRVILEHRIQELQSLEIPSAELQRVITVASHHSLSLRTLIVNCNHNSSGVITDMWNLLPLCPELRVLTIAPFRTRELPPHLAPHIIPHLESLSVQPRLAPTFTAGRSVKNVTIYHHNDIALDGIRQIVGECVALRELTLTVAIHAYQGLVSFIRSLKIYPDLVVLRMAFVGHTRWFPLTSKRTPEELEGFIDALRQLTALRICNVTGYSHSRDPTVTISPMGSMGNPNDRGHTSLERVRVECIDPGWWVWYHAEGWQRIPDSGRSAYSLH